MAICRKPVRFIPVENSGPIAGNPAVKTCHLTVLAPEDVCCWIFEGRLLTIFAFAACQDFISPANFQKT
jgi:hypothetical protein